MAFAKEGLRLAVVRGEVDERGGARGEEREELPDEDVQASLELLPGLRECDALVVRVRPGQDVGSKFGPPEPGSVAINRSTFRGPEFPPYLGVVGEHRGEIHDLPEAHYPRPRKDLGHLPRPELRSRGPEGTRGHTGGRREEHAQREPFRGLKHVPDPTKPEGVGDLVGVGDHSRGPVGKHGPGELWRGQPRALQVHVGVDDPWDESGPGEVHDLLRLRRPEPRDQAFGHGHIARPELPEGHIEDRGPAEEVGRGEALGGAEGADRDHGAKIQIFSLRCQSEERRKAAKLSYRTCPAILLISAVCVAGVRRFHWARDVEEALLLLASYDGRGALLAGGVDLARSARQDLEGLIDIIRIRFSFLEQKEGRVRIGATTTLTTVLEHPASHRYAGGVLAEALSRVAVAPLRNMATLGGVVVSAYPWADIPTLLIALGAEARWQVEKENRAPVEELFYRQPFRGIFRKAVLTEIVLPPWKGAFAFENVSRSGYDIALLNAACGLGLREGKIAWARVALGATPYRGERLPWLVEEALVGEVPGPNLWEKVQGEMEARAEVEEDRRAGASWRESVAGVLVSRALALAAAKLTL